MSRFLIAWELGGGYGHIASLAPLAKSLLERGHQVYFALRDLSYAQVMLGDFDCPLLQAPVRVRLQVGQRTSAATFAELLSRVGYLDVGAMIGRIRGWRTLFDLVQPDVLIAEHAPTALLASRGSNLIRIVVGTGFTCPPPSRPMPRLSINGGSHDAAQLELEARVLANANDVLARIDAPPLDALGDLYAVDDQQLCTFAELDPFATYRTKPLYVGPRGLGGNGVAPRWPQRGSKRLFGYLKTEMAGFEALIRHLSTSAEAALVHVPGMPAQFVERFSSPSLVLSQEPVNLIDVAAACDGAISLAGHGTTCQLLLEGCPLLLVPSQVEQRLTAERVVNMGAGLRAAADRQSPPPYPSLINRLLGDPQLAAGARGFAERHAGFNEHHPVVDAVQRIEALLAN